MRLHDWPERLSRTIVAARGTPFAPGDHDCCLFMADCVEALTGEDIAAAWRGQYATEAEGMLLARVRSLPELADRFFPRVHPAYAHRGDVAVAPVGDMRDGKPQLVLLVVLDGGFLRGASGAQFPRHVATQAWRVD